MDVNLSRKIKTIVADTHLEYDYGISADKAYDEYIRKGESKSIKLNSAFKNERLFITEDMQLMFRDIAALFDPTDTTH